MAKGPLTAEELSNLGDFLFDLLNGRANLGLGALGMVDTYKRAKDQGLNLGSIFGQSPKALEWTANLLHQHSSRIPKSALAVLELVVAAAKNPPKPEVAAYTQSTPGGSADDV